MPAEPGAALGFFDARRFFSPAGFLAAGLRAFFSAAMAGTVASGAGAPAPAGHDLRADHQGQEPATAASSRAAALVDRGGLALDVDVAGDGDALAVPGQLDAVAL